MQSSEIYLCQPPLGTQIDHGNPISHGIWCSYAFNERGGKEALDSSGMGNNVLSFTGTDPVWTGFGLRVGNTVGYVRGNKTVKSSFNPGRGSHTVRVVHIPRAWTGGFTAIIDVAGTGGSGRMLSIFADTSGNISYRGIAGADGSATANTVGMTLGRVNDLVWVRAFGDGTGGTPKTHFWYLDGVLKHTENGLTSTTWPTDGIDFAAGGNITGGGSAYDGEYLLIQCWDRALSPSEVAWLAGNPYGLYSPGPFTIDVGAQVSATGSGSPGTITLTVPTGTAFPVQDGLAQGDIDTIDLTAPTGIGGSSASGSGDVGVILLTAPTGTAEATTGTGSGDIGTIFLQAPTAAPFGPRFTISAQDQYYWGRFSRGQYLNIMWNPSETPDDVATVDFWLEGTTLKTSITLPVLDEERFVFGFPILLNGDFEDGNYAAVIRFSSGGVSYSSVAYFEARGGEAFPPVIAILEVDRTLGRGVVTQDAEGEMLIGYDPRLRSVGLE